MCRVMRVCAITVSKHTRSNLHDGGGAFVISLQNEQTDWSLWRR